MVLGLNFKKTAEGGEVREIFDGLRQELENVSQALPTQGVNQAIPNFDGTPSKFKQWVKAIDKYAILAALSNDKEKLVAYQTSTGAVSGFIERYISSNQNCTWTDVRAELAQRFAEIYDFRMAFSMLKFVKTRKTRNTSFLCGKNNVHSRKSIPRDAHRTCHRATYGRLFC